MEILTNFLKLGLKYLIYRRFFVLSSLSNQIFCSRCNTSKRVTSWRGPSPRHCARATQLLSKKCRGGGARMATLCLISSAGNLNLKPSSVARGRAKGAIAPIGLKSMRNSVVFAVLRLIFALKTKIAPPKQNWGESGEDSEMMSTSGSGLQCS